MNFYLIRNRKAPWGDYGNILFYGFLSDISDQIVIERIGPFLPPAYFIFGHIVVDDSAKHILETFDLKGVDYSLAQKKKIVNLDWKDWSFEEKIPYKPKSGEPEDFILKGKHDEILAKNLGEIWVITPVETARGLIDKSKMHIPGMLTPFRGYCPPDFGSRVVITNDLTILPFFS